LKGVDIMKSRKSKLVFYLAVDLVILAAILSFQLFYNNSLADGDIPSPSGSEINEIIEDAADDDQKPSDKTEAIKPKNETVALDIQRIKDSIKQLQEVQRSYSEDISKLKVIAPFSGYVSEILSGVGDSIAPGGSILTLTDKSKLRLIVPFTTTSKEGIVVGQTAKVCIWAFMDYVEGTVSRISGQPRYDDDGIVKYDVEIIIDNPGAIEEGMEADVEITTPSAVRKSFYRGQIEYVKTTIEAPETGGKIKYMPVSKNTFVNKGDILADLQNDELLSRKRVIDILISDLQQQL
jgi:HlyD family secretion protein